MPAHAGGAARAGPAYSAAKAGVNSFTEMLNLTEREHGIRAFAVWLGEVSTPILEQRPHPPSEQARALMLQPEDLARILLVVASLPHLGGGRAAHGDIDRPAELGGGDRSGRRTHARAGGSLLTLAG